ncbi:MAG: hypothetical protein DME20_04515 [Verrucomicrobia bacterium]|nr:MAG: hypothetical protein DME20_04515 [Verrucomicrobiota bacterium]
MSDRDLGKKMVEEEHLLRFLEAHAKVTGVSMKVVSNGESPDFICTRPSGERVGIELARSPTITTTHFGIGSGQTGRCLRTIFLPQFM